jgi:hypothetical protein
MWNSRPDRTALSSQHLQVFCRSPNPVDTAEACRNAALLRRNAFGIWGKSKLGVVMRGQSFPVPKVCSNAVKADRYPASDTPSLIRNFPTLCTSNV